MTTTIGRDQRARDIEAIARQQMTEVNAKLAELNLQPPRPLARGHDERNGLKGVYAGYVMAMQIVALVARDGLPVAPSPIVSVLALPCGRTIGTEAPMPDGHTVCACGAVHGPQPLAETAAPWLVSADA